MILIKCKECGNKVSSTATACPKCGAKIPKWVRLLKKIALYFTGFIAFLFIAYAMGAIIMSGVAASTDKDSSPFFWSVALLDALLVCASLGIYTDATKHKIGPVPGAKGLLNISGATIATFALWWAPLVIPMYLVQRHDLIARAKEHPFEEKGLSAYLFFVVLYVLLSPILFIELLAKLFLKRSAMAFDARISASKWLRFPFLRQSFKITAFPHP